MVRYIVLYIIFLQGCATLNDISLFAGKKDPRLLETSYKAAAHLDKQVAKSGAKGFPMLAASFVNSADVESSNDLGRLLSEQVASRLSQLGYSVSDVQLRADELVLRPESGVLALSRDVDNISADPEAFSILVGTYTIIERQIYVNARVLRTSDGVALGSSDFVLPHIRLHGQGPHQAVPSTYTRLQ